MSEDLVNAIANIEEEKTIFYVKSKIKKGESALHILEECMAGIKKVGEKYSEGKYFLSDLIMSGEIFREVMEILLTCW